MNQSMRYKMNHRGKVAGLTIMTRIKTQVDCSKRTCGEASKSCVVIAKMRDYVKFRFFDRGTPTRS